MAAMDIRPGAERLRDDPHVPARCQRRVERRTTCSVLRLAMALLQNGSVAFFLLVEGFGASRPLFAAKEQP
jgi:hypothetical protein